ncbi:Peptide methionine sulfoxide reductase B5 [Capsicum annuum]|nr:Peptide methionine sulfoxide reductase B5 [Capsicum annuum]
MGSQILKISPFTLIFSSTSLLRFHAKRNCGQFRHLGFVCSSKRRFRGGIIAMATPGSVHKSEEEWRAILSPEQFRILRQKGTDFSYVGETVFWFLSEGPGSLSNCSEVFPASPPFGNLLRTYPGTGEYDKFSGEGVYQCAGCGTPLYNSTTKFNSGCGWPAFFEGLPGAINRTCFSFFHVFPDDAGVRSEDNPDPDGRRIEITCAACGGHLGHVFKGKLSIFKGSFRKPQSGKLIPGYSLMRRNDNGSRLIPNKANLDFCFPCDMLGRGVHVKYRSGSCFLRTILDSKVSLTVLLNRTFKIFVQSNDFQAWVFIKKGPKPILGLKEKQKDKESRIVDVEDLENFEVTKEQQEVIQTNERAISLLLCAVNDEEYDKISTCKIAKKMWDKLEVTYEENTKVKKANINALVNEYELFKMEENGSVESMFTRFSKIVCEPKSLGDDLSTQSASPKACKKPPKSMENQSCHSRRQGSPQYDL